MLIEKIYNDVYAGSEDGKQEEFNVSEEISGILGDVKDNSVDRYELEGLLSNAAGIGLVHGFKAGLRFVLQVLVELV